MKNKWIYFACLLLTWQIGIAQLSNVFALDAKTLAANKSRIKASDPTITTAYKLLLKDANAALQFGPVSVMEKSNIPPSGNKHDYMSLAPYFWPDPSKPNGLPYMRKDGETNPEVKDYKDKEYMPQLCDEIHTLALAYYFSNEPKYAEHAAKLIRVWFLDTATKMNPNLNFGQAIKGVTTGRGAGMIDSRHFVKLIDAAGLLQGSKTWTAADYSGLKTWFGEFLHWMQTSKIGLDEMHALNNHGVWYDAQRLSMALFLDSADLAKQIIANAENRLDKQLNDVGLFPLEMERTTSLHYTVFVLQAFLNIAQMAEKTNIDFWAYKSSTGKSLQKALDEIIPYLAQQKKWTGPQIKTFDYEEGYSLLMAAFEHYDCKACKEIIEKLAADKYPRLRIHLTNQ